MQVVFAVGQRIEHSLPLVGKDGDLLAAFGIEQCDLQMIGGEGRLSLRLEYNLGIGAGGHFHGESHQLAYGVAVHGFHKVWLPAEMLSKVKV